MRIALSGYYGFDNAGDEALLAAITSSIRRLEPSTRFVVFSGSPERTRALHGIEAVHQMNPLALIYQLRRSDLLISGGGSIFQDVTSWRSLPYYITVVALAKALGKPVIFYAQGVGPINRRLSKWLMRIVANKVDMITVRDEYSSRFLYELGVTHPPLLVTADPVFSLRPDSDDMARISRLLTAFQLDDRPLIGVSVRRWAALAAYREQLARLLDDLALRGYGIMFIPMAYPEDVAESNLVLKQMQQKAVVIDEHLTSQEHLALISRLDLMIAMRLHALIFAANRGIPFAGISYDPKVDAFLDLFRLKPLGNDYPAMKATVDKMLRDNILKVEIRLKAEEQRDKSEQNAHLALSLIKPNEYQRL